MKSEIRDGMKIDWDAPIEMDDGVVLRADVFRPVADGKYPVIMSYGPYAKGLSMQEGYKSQWTRIVKAAPEVLEGSSNKHQNWDLFDPEKWVPDGYACLRIDPVVLKYISIDRDASRVLQFQQIFYGPVATEVRRIINLP